MMTPATIFIILWCLDKNSITSWLFAAEMNASSNNGKPIPNPKKAKLRKFVKKLTVEVLIANKTIKDAGLQGSTMAPKNRPKRSELKKGFLSTGACVCGKNFPRLTLIIKRKLITARMPKAIGETTPIALASEA